MELPCRWCPPCYLGPCISSLSTSLLLGLFLLIGSLAATVSSSALAPATSHVPSLPLLLLIRHARMAIELPPKAQPPVCARSNCIYICPGDTRALARPYLGEAVRLWCALAVIPRARNTRARRAAFVIAARGDVARLKCKFAVPSLYIADPTVHRHTDAPVHRALGWTY